MFTEKFMYLLQINNLTAYKVSKGTGISQGLMNEYKNGIKTPNIENLVKIANFLNCTTDYLLGRTDKPDMTITVNQTGEIIEASPINAINNAGQPLSEMTAELVKMFETLNFSNKMKVMNFVIDLKGKE